MSWLKRNGHRLLTLYAAFAFIQSLFFKFSGSPETVHIFQGKLDPLGRVAGLRGRVRAWRHLLGQGGRQLRAARLGVVAGRRRDVAPACGAGAGRGARARRDQRSNLLSPLHPARRGGRQHRRQQRWRRTVHPRLRGEACVCHVAVAAARRVARLDRKACRPLRLGRAARAISRSARASASARSSAAHWARRSRAPSRSPANRPPATTA